MYEWSGPYCEVFSASQAASQDGVLIQSCRVKRMADVDGGQRHSNLRIPLASPSSRSNVLDSEEHRPWRQNWVGILVVTGFGFCTDSFTSRDSVFSTRARTELSLC